MRDDGLAPLGVGGEQEAALAIKRHKTARGRQTKISSPATARFLVIVDGSDASARAVSYLARLFAPPRSRGVRFCLASIMPPPPAGLLEFGGAENPREEQRLTGRLRAAQDSWTESAERAPEARLAALAARLRGAGIGAASVETYLSSPLDQRNAVEEVLMLARERDCDTIVIGYDSNAVFGADHLAERLIRGGEGVAIWVVA
jgi:nucleotide-binding universal stress UspA family protein